MLKQVLRVCVVVALARADTLDTLDTQWHGSQPQHDRPYNSQRVLTSYGPAVSPAHAAAAGVPVNYGPAGFGVQNQYDGYMVPEASWLSAAAGPASAVVGYKLTALGVLVKVIGWLVVHAWAVLLGAVATFAFCKVTALCDLTHHHVFSHARLQQVRTFMAPERLASASDFLHSAIDKYSKERSEDSASTTPALAPVASSSEKTYKKKAAHEKKQY